MAVLLWARVLNIRSGKLSAAEQLSGCLSWVIISGETSQAQCADSGASSSFASTPLGKVRVMWRSAVPIIKEHPRELRRWTGMGAEMGVLSPVMDCLRTKQMGKTMGLEQRQICHFTALTVGSGDSQIHRYRSRLCGLEAVQPSTRHTTILASYHLVAK